MVWPAKKEAYLVFGLVFNVWFLVFWVLGLGFGVLGFGPRAIWWS